MAEGAKTFFSKELSELEHNIQRLENALRNYDSDDPHSKGLRLELETVRKNRELVEELAAYAHDPAMALLQGRIKQRQIESEHAESRDGSAESVLRSDKWWDTLSQAQYLSDLNRRMEEWIKAHPDVLNHH